MSARGGVIASVGAAGGAVLSSACCWLPLLLVGVGVSASGLGAFFERHRTVLLVVTIGLLALAFVLVYRPRACREGSACARDSRGRGGRFAKSMLWVSTIVVGAFAAFPDYAGSFLGGSGGDVEAASAETGASVRTIGIEGMTCELCAVHLRTGLVALVRIGEARVDSEGGSATLVVDGEVDDEAIDGVIEGLGCRRR